MFGSLHAGLRGFSFFFLWYVYVFISWNYHGVASINFLRAMKLYVRVHNLSIVILPEPRISGIHAQKVIKKLRFSHPPWVEAIGFSGEIQLLWQDMVYMTGISLCSSRYEWSKGGSLPNEAMEGSWVGWIAYMLLPEVLGGSRGWCFCEVEWIFSVGSFHPSMSMTLISLVPKVVNHINFSHFRPISLCSVVYGDESYCK